MTNHPCVLNIAQGTLQTLAIFSPFSLFQADKNKLNEHHRLHARNMPRNYNVASFPGTGSAQRPTCGATASVRGSSNTCPRSSSRRRRRRPLLTWCGVRTSSTTTAPTCTTSTSSTDLRPTRTDTPSTCRQLTQRSSHTQGPDPRGTHRCPTLMRLFLFFVETGVGEKKPSEFLSVWGHMLGRNSMNKA